MKFEDLWLIGPLLKTIARQGFSTPTEIQEKVIPLATRGNDILGCAQTGSGKTLAFVLPTIQKLYNNRIEKELPDGPIKRKIEALIIAPTRELAIQIGEACKPYCSDANMKHTVIFGGVNDFHQIKAIEKWVDILVATPGRLEDLISQWVVKLSYVQILTLDEADIMLDLGFLGDINKIIKRIPKQRQTFFFSATLPNQIQTLADSLLHCPEKITIKAQEASVQVIQQQLYHVEKPQRRQLLQMLVKKKIYPSMIVFVKQKDDIAHVMACVQAAWVRVDCIHKDRTQNGRQQALAALKNWDIKVLVATDIASRWLDVNDLSCVINYNIPAEAETYVHRIGRTARAGKKWTAISFLVREEQSYLEAIEVLTGSPLEVITDKSYLKEKLNDLQVSASQKLKDKYPRKKKNYSKK